jgi:transcription-repair coupling factor (superfamily II helicase)
LLPIQSLFEKVVTKKDLEKNTLKLSVTENVSLDFVNEILFEYNFNRVDFVTEPGDFQFVEESLMCSHSQMMNLFV